MTGGRLRLLVLHQQPKSNGFSLCASGLAYVNFSGRQVEVAQSPSLRRVVLVQACSGYGLVIATWPLVVC